MKKFRVHHILCTVLYQGEGYSGAFCDNMTQKVHELKDNLDGALILVTDPDMICARCPNRTPDDTCLDEKNHVKIKDLELLKLFGGKKIKAILITNYYWMQPEKWMQKSLREVVENVDGIRKDYVVMKCGGKAEEILRKK